MSMVIFLSTRDVRNVVCMQTPTWGRGSESTHIYPENHSGGKNKKIAFYQAEIKWISATAEWLGNSIHFNVLWAVIPISIQRHRVSQEQLEKSIQHFLYFHIFFQCVFFFSSIKTILLQVSRNNADLSSPCSFLFVYIIYRESLLQPLHLDYLTLAIIKYYCDLFLSS